MCKKHAPRCFVLAVGAAALLAPQITTAAVLEHFDFGPGPKAILTPTLLGEGMLASPITGGAGNSLDLNSDQTNAPASTPWLRINPGAVYSNAAAAIAADARFMFTLSVIPGFTMDLESLAFNALKGGNSQRGYAVTTSAGQIGTNPWTADIPTYRRSDGPGTVWTPVNISLADSAYQGLTSITFSIYSYAVGGTSSVEYDDIFVKGATTFNGYTWQGATAAWNTSTPNWSGPGAMYVDAGATSNALFNDAGTNTNVVVDPGALTPNLVTFTNNTKDYSFGGGNLNVATSLFKSGTGKTTFNNTVTAGSVTANRGVLEVGAGGVLTSANVTVSQGGNLRVADGGTLGTTSGVTVNGTLELDNANQTIATLSGSNTGILNLDGMDLDNNDVTAVVLEVTGASTFSGKITGPGALVKSGTGTLALSGVNDFTGGTTVTGGALQLTNAKAGGLNGVAVETNGTLLLGAALESGITLKGGVLGVSAAVTLPKTMTVTVQENSTVATFNAVTQTTKNDLILSGPLRGSGNINLIAQNGDNPDAGGAFRLRGPASDYSGTITVPKAGKFEIRTDVDSGSPMGTGKLVMTGGAFTVDQNNATGLLGNYSLINVRNASAKGNVYLGNNVEIAGSGIAVFNMVNEGGVTIAGSESTFGDLLIGGGQTVIAASTGTPGYTLGFQTVHLTGGNATFTPRPVGNIAFTATEHIRLGVISENAAGSGITVNGVGSVTLSGNNTYTGDTVVTAGTLVLVGSITGSATEVNGGTFTGGGTADDVTLAGGTLAPGSGVGILTTGDLTLSSGTLAIEIGGSTSGLYDQLNVTGGVTLEGPVSLTLSFGTYDPIDNVDKFTLINNTGTGAIALNSETARFTFGGIQLNEGAIFTAISGSFTQDFQISYAGGNGNDVVLAAVPEPATAATLLGGLALLGLRRRRR